MKKILILGAGFLQSFVIKKAKEMGYQTLAIDKNPNSTGFSFADEYEVVDIIDKEACLEYAQLNKIDGVMTAATDYGVLSAAHIANRMNLPGIDYEVAKVIKNKYLVRRTLYESRIDDISQYYEVGSVSELESIKERIHFPVMVKPCDGSGSKAAQRVDTIRDLYDACDTAINNSLIGRALIEDFIDGEEYGVESIVCNGEIHVLGVMGKRMTNPPDYAELGHFMPSQLANEDKVRRVVKSAIKALGINFGGVNMDLLVTKDDRICIVDVGARMGGNLIGSHIIPLGTGIDYMSKLISMAVGDPVKIELEASGVHVATRLLALKPGKIKELPDFDIIKQKCQVDIYHHLMVGNTIKEYHNNLDGCGYIVCVADDVMEAEKRAEEARCLIDEGILRE